jgi:aryl-alcohol dehydrogenase-like predicted oxidoreductase
MSSEATTQKRQLGQSGILVTPIGLGGNKFSGGKSGTGLVYPGIPQGEINAIVQASLDGGVDWFDTAELYGGGRSEEALSTALRAAGKDDGEVIVATKWSPFLRTASNIARSIDKRLHLLQGYSIDLYMVHMPYSFSSREAEMDAMADLAEAGKIRSVGVSNFDAEQMRRAHTALEKRGLPLAANQVQYNLLQRKIESNGVLDAARELGVTIIAWAPLASGLLTGRFHEDPAVLGQTPIGRRMMLGRKIEPSRPVVEALDEIAARYNVTPAQVALNWLINVQGETVVAIPGASRAQQAAQNAAVMGFRLSDEEMDHLNKVSDGFR